MRVACCAFFRNMGMLPQRSPNTRSLQPLDPGPHLPALLGSPPPSPLPSLPWGRATSDVAGCRHMDPRQGGGRWQGGAGTALHWGNGGEGASHCGFAALRALQGCVVGHTPSQTCTSLCFSHILPNSQTLRINPRAQYTSACAPAEHPTGGIPANLHEPGCHTAHAAQPAPCAAWLATLRIGFLHLLLSSRKRTKK